MSNVCNATYYLGSQDQVFTVFFQLYVIFLSLMISEIKFQADEQNHSYPGLRALKSPTSGFILRIIVKPFSEIFTFDSLATALVCSRIMSAFIVA